MKNISYVLPNWFGTGLSNQLFFLIWGIINAHNNKHKLLIVDKFRQEPLKDSMCYMSEIIDFVHLNNLLNNYGIELIDRKDINIFKINKITYGADNKFFDITNEIIKSFYTENKLSIPSRFSLNDLKGDPILIT